MKIVINNCYGGFHLSEKAIELLIAKGVDKELVSDYRFGEYRFAECKRDNKLLVEVVEELGKEANDSSYSSLSVVEIPDEATDWVINEYDGSEDIIYVLDGKIKYAY